MPTLLPLLPNSSAAPLAPRPLPQELARGTAVQRQQKVPTGSSVLVLLRADTLLHALDASSAEAAVQPASPAVLPARQASFDPTAFGGFEPSPSASSAAELEAEPPSPRGAAPGAGIGGCPQAMRSSCCLPRLRLPCAVVRMERSPVLDRARPC